VTDKVIGLYKEDPSCAMGLLASTISSTHV